MAKFYTDRFLNLDNCINANCNYESFRSRLISQPNSNKNYKNVITSKQKNLVPITFNELIPEDEIRTNDSGNTSILQNDVCSTSKYVNIMMDSGASLSIIHDSFVHADKFNTRKTSKNKWSTMAGSFLTLCKAEDKIKLPELNVMAHIFAPYYVISQKSNYNVIYDQDLQHELGINLDF